MYFKKKALSSIVGISLLLFVSVLSIISLQNWFTSSSFNFFNPFVEKESLNSIDIIYIENDILYIKNLNVNAISFSEIKINSESCGVSGVLINQSQSGFSLNNCTLNIPMGPVEVNLITENGLYSENIFIRDELTFLSCTLNGTTVNHSLSYNFYNSSSVPYGQNCSAPVSRTCNDGVLNGDSSYQYSNCSALGSQDITPDAFNFINQTDVNSSIIITSNTLTPIGYEGTISISIIGEGNPEFSVAGGSWTNSSTITLGQNLTIRLNSSSSQGITSIATLTTGDYSVNWSVRTIYPLYVEYLVVAGGGGGGGGSTSGGGGAGGFKTGVGFSVSVGVPIEVIVGLGGSGGGAGGGGSGVIGSNGGNSSFDTIVSVGGGGGAPDQGTGANGGSGGGAGGSGGIDSNGGSASPAGQGNDGGHNDWTNTAPYSSGGGGGAGSAGQNAPSNSVCGNGGDGLNSSISGTLTWYAGGGGGGNSYGATRGLGGIGGGGNGTTAGTGGTGIANTGGGGGGGANAGGASGGNGGSGIVIIKYVGSQQATGGTINTSGGNTTHTFISSGNFTVY